MTNNFDNLARRSASEEEQRIRDIVKREIRETFKNGLPSGRYSSYLWDGIKIVGGGAGFALDAICTMSAIPAQTVLGDATPYRVDFDDVLHDPLSQVTTGASWAFTAAATGTYIVFACAPLDIGDSTDWVTADRVDMTLEGAVSEVLQTWVGIAVEARPAPIPLRGFYAAALDAADVIYVRLVQDCGTDRDIESAEAVIVIGHV